MCVCIYIYIEICIYLCVYLYYTYIYIFNVNSGRLPHFPRTPAVAQIAAGDLKVLSTASWTESTSVMPRQAPASQKQTFKSYPRRQRMPHRGPSQQGGNLHKRDDRNTCDPKPTISSDRL